MGILNLLASDVGVSVYGQTFDVSLNWIGNLIKALITGVGSVGVGIILFSVILRLVVLPFDIYQRVAMRKQNIKMKENQAKMEKLQKQYANNKELYNQKVMEMYKESGFSMFSSCLPMILSMVIFIVAINAFNAYSQYSNIENYNTMVQAYNANMQTYCADIDASSATVTEDGNLLYIKDSADGKYIYYTVTKAEAEDQTAYIKGAEKLYYIDAEKALANAEIKAYVDAAVAANTNETLTAEKKQETALKYYFIEKAQNAVVTAYEETVRPNTGFLWIKNIWVTDAAYKHPVLEHNEFETEVSREKFLVNGEKVSLNELPTNVYGSDAYNDITGKLNKQKGQANGYFVLILLSIGTILLQQFVSMRSQKEQQKYSSVDGQGASQQKMMMVMMTGMFAIFAFMYSSAFSIYMIMSNVLSMISTLIINQVVDKKESAREQKEMQEKYNMRFPGRNKDNTPKKK